MTGDQRAVPGLINRRMFRIDGGRVCVQEEWNIDVPGCPMIRNPWMGLQCDGSVFIRQVVMTEDEFNENRIPLFG